MRMENKEEALRRLEFVREQNAKKAEKPKTEEKLPRVPKFINEYARDKK